MGSALFPSLSGNREIIGSNPTGVSYFPPHKKSSVLRTSLRQSMMCAFAPTSSPCSLISFCYVCRSARIIPWITLHNTDISPSCQILTKKGQIKFSSFLPKYRGRNFPETWKGGLEMAGHIVCINFIECVPSPGSNHRIALTFWQAHWQPALVQVMATSHYLNHCCRCACQISERSCGSKYKSRGFEILWDLTIRRLAC